MNRFSLGSDSRTWWLRPGLAGAAAAGVVAASLALVPTGGADAQPWAPWDDVQRGYAHVPAPDLQRNYAHIPGPDPQSCPDPPDPRYVAGPWVAPGSECPTMRLWWRYVK